MLFNSLHFLWFFTAVTTVYFILPHKYRWQHLLIASCYFYMVFMPIYILILGFTIVIDYFAGIYIENAENRRRKLFLVISLVANIGILAVFKYFNFLNENISILLNEIGYQNTIPNLSILLPIGLSFHTFQAMSYTIEVYRGNQKAEKHFGLYALYVMFYPQLVAGPIERPQNVLPQFYEKKALDYQNITTGLRLMAWGLFKKVVIADRLTLVVDKIYGEPTSFYGMPLIIATVSFAIQIYCDFSGYSDMAIGSARVMGFNLMKNFDTPYFSKSISEFWKRWHISLSTWFRDYLYISLGGNRVSTYRIYFNLSITFLISGLWHGANWTYVIWGGLNGLFLISEMILNKQWSRIKVGEQSNSTKCIINLIKTVITFILICITWVFFRAHNVSDAFYIVTHFFDNFTSSISIALSDKIGTTKLDIIIIVYAISVLFFVEYLQYKNFIIRLLHRSNQYVRIVLYSTLLVSILFLGIFDTNNQFIYFQF